MATSFKLMDFASTASGQRTCNGATFSDLKKFASHFFNPGYAGTFDFLLC